MSSGTMFWRNSPDGLIYKYDVGIAKNYLNKSESKQLNNLTNLFLDYAEEEKILNNDSVAYGNHNTLINFLEYDISLEKAKIYKDMNIVEVINNITKFFSSIWQIHPFREGNTPPYLSKNI